MISREQFLDNIIVEILKKLPPIFDIVRVRKRYETHMTPLAIVLIQELERFNNLITVMNRSLLLLKKALCGEIGMDSTLENISQSLYNGQIPKKWRLYAPQTSMNLGSWMEHFQKRTDQYVRWTKKNLVVTWISGLHVPESFFTALVQIECRRNQWPLDKSTLYITVSDYFNVDEIERRPKKAIIFVF